MMTDQDTIHTLNTFPIESSGQLIEIYPRGFPVTPFGDHPLQEKWLLDFISSGDPALIPPEYSVMTGTRELARTTTRNLRLFNEHKDTELVINGFGYSEKISKYHIIFHPPAPDKDYGNFIAGQGGMVSKARKNDGVTQLGELSIHHRHLPLGTLGLEGLQIKVNGYGLFNEVIPTLGVNAAFPALVGAFAYGDELNGSYGLVYKCPHFTPVLDIIKLRGWQVFTDFVRQEFRVIRALVDAGFTHYDLHLGNKGLTTDGTFFMSDPQLFVDNRQRSDILYLSDCISMLATAIEADLVATFAGNGKMGRLDLSMYSDKRFEVFIREALKGFGIIDDQLFERTVSRIIYTPDEMKPAKRGSSLEKRFGPKELLKYQCERDFNKVLVRDIATKMMFAKDLQEEDFKEQEV